MIHKKGTCKTFGIRGWFDRNGIANIISLMELAKTCKVTMDTSDSFKGFKVTTAEGKEILFTPCEYGPGGLYKAFYKVDEVTGKLTFSNKLKPSLPAYSFTTVAKRMEKYTKHEIEEATIAKKYYDRLTLSPTALAQPHSD